MKTRIFKYIAVVALLFMAIPMQGQNYLKLWFKDGHTERHFMHLVKSISATKYDLEGNLHSDYQMQQIIMEDTTYSYYIADIDSMSFKKVDEEILVKTIKSTVSSIESIYKQCNGLENMIYRMDEIRNIEGVDSVWNVGSDVIVQIRDWRKIFYHFHDYESESVASFSQKAKQTLPKQLTTVKAPKVFNQYNSVDVAIVDQTAKDERFSDAVTQLGKLPDYFNYLGFNAEYITCSEVNLDFFKNRMFNYDVVHIQSHGSYDGKRHWIWTGQELSPMELTVFTLNDVDAWNVLYDIDEVAPSHFDEIRNNQIVDLYYLGVSEDFIQKGNVFGGHEPTIIFNGTCVSLKGNDHYVRVIQGTYDSVTKSYKDHITETYNDHVECSTSLADIFHQKGADIYFGYTESQSVGPYASYWLFRWMLDGNSEGSALYHLHRLYRPYTDVKLADKDGNVVSYYLLDLFAPNYYIDEPKSTFLVKTKTIDCGVNSELEGTNKVTLIGETTIFDIEETIVTCGFKYGADPDLLKDVEEVEVEKEKLLTGDYYSGNVIFSADIPIPAGCKRLYYQAYTYDRIYRNLGEILYYDVPEASTPYHDLCPDGNHPHMIDLGLPSGTKWSCCNVGASVPTAYGNYYAWGETSTKSTYTKENYKYHHTDSDGKYVYEDATFTMAPTPDQVKELFANCTATETSVDGVAGEKLTSKKNGKKIFLPYGGAKGTSTVGVGEEYQYWTSQLEKSASNSKLLAPRQYSDNETDDLGNPYAFDWYEKDFRYIGKTVRKASK